jgi:hypothetical protein
VRLQRATKVLQRGGNASIVCTPLKKCPAAESFYTTGHRRKIIPRR